MVTKSKVTSRNARPLRVAASLELTACTSEMLLTFLFLAFTLKVWPMRPGSPAGFLA